MGAPVVTRDDAAPVLDAAEHIFNLVPLFIKFLVVFNGGFTIFPRRYARRNPFFQQRHSKPVGIVTAIRQ